MTMFAWIILRHVIVVPSANCSLVTNADNTVQIYVFFLDAGRWRAWVVRFLSTESEDAFVL